MLIVKAVSHDLFFLCVTAAFVGAQNYDLIPAAKIYVQVRIKLVSTPLNCNGFYSSLAASLPSPVAVV